MLNTRACWMERVLNNQILQTIIVKAMSFQKACRNTDHKISHINYISVSGWVVSYKHRSLLPSQKGSIITNWYETESESRFEYVDEEKDSIISTWNHILTVLLLLWCSLWKTSNHVWGLFEKFVDLLFWVIALWRCGGDLFFQVPPLVSNVLLRVLHPLVENVLQTICCKLQENSEIGTVLGLLPQG